MSENTELVITVCELCGASMGVELGKKHGEVYSAACPQCGIEHYFMFDIWLYLRGRIRNIFKIVFGMKEAKDDSR